MARTKRQARDVATLEALQTQNEALQKLLQMQPVQPTPRNTPANQMHVAIRNVSSYPIGVRGEFGAPDLDLHPAIEGIDNPNSVAVVSYIWWQKLRRGKIYDNGMIVRDDSRLDPAYLAGPPDAPGDLAPNHDRNMVEFPDQWIESRDENQLRDDIMAMTSEQSLRRLWAAVDLCFAKELAKTPKEDPMEKRIKRAERMLPGKHQLVEDLVQDRLDELNPLTSERARELDSGARLVEHPRLRSGR